MYQRRLVAELIQRLSEPRRFIQIVTGPRQTGKTTAINQAIASLTAEVRYFSADEQVLASRAWLSNVWEQTRLVAERQSEVVLIIDEIQKVPQWPDVVKALWDEDTHRHIPIKVVLSGSSPLLLKKGLDEALMGRFEVLHSPHWSLLECAEAFDFTVEEFISYGGYPGAAELRHEHERWQRYISTAIIEPTISEDVLHIEDVRKPALLRALFETGASYSAQELSYSKILGQLQEEGNSTTLAHYLELLSHAGILCGIQKFSAEKVRQRKSSSRFMVYDTSLMVVASGASPAQVTGDTMFRGHLVESAVGAYLLARSLQDGFRLYYWRERNHEVDFVLQKGDAITAIEVKSGRKRGEVGLQAFMQRYPQALFYIVGSSSCPLEGFLRGEVALFKSMGMVYGTTPVTEDEVVAAFWDFIHERREAGVLAAQAVSSIDYVGRSVHVTFDPPAIGLSNELFLSVNPFSNYAEFVGVPITLNDAVGVRIRPMIDRVETVFADGTSLGALTATELHQMGVAES